jgi:nitrogen fixation-related uncharacterized protein
MDVLILLIFVSLVLVAASLLFLLVRIRGGDFEHLDRLPFLPLEPDRRDDPAADPGPSTLMKGDDS